MKHLSYYSLRKRHRLLWIPVILLISIMYACGPSYEESVANRKANLYQELTKGTIINVYTTDSCEYIGMVNFNAYDLFAHRGRCKFCEKRQANLIDSLIKKNLENFFNKKIKNPQNSGS